MDLAEIKEWRDKRHDRWGGGLERGGESARIDWLIAEVERLTVERDAERERCAGIVQNMVLAGRVADAVAAKIRSGEPA